MPEASGSFGLFLKGPPDATPKNNAFPLTAFGGSAGATGVFGGFPLFVGGQVTAPLGLFLRGSTIGVADASLGLNLTGQAPSFEGSTTLFLYNAWAEKTGSFPAFIQGSGETDGAVPFAGSMGLFIQRNTPAVLNLFLKAQDTQASGQFPLFVDGVYSHASGLPLYLRADYATGSTKLFTSGF